MDYSHHFFVIVYLLLQNFQACLEQIRTIRDEYITYFCVDEINGKLLITVLDKS